MAHSYSRQFEIPCPNCAKSLTIHSWLIVDAVERPDLATQIRDGTMHASHCDHCAAAIKLDAPVLIFGLPGAPPLVFCPAEQAPQAESMKQTAELLDRLRAALGTSWDDAWVKNGLPTAKLAELRGSKTKEPQEPTTELKEPAIPPADRTILLTAIMNLINTADPQQMRLLIQGNPLLLNDAADTYLSQGIVRAQASDNTQMARVFQQRLTLLRRCREIGIDAALAEPVQPTPSPELDQAIRELLQSRNVHDPALIIQLARKVLSLLPRDMSPLLWAGAQLALAENITESAEGDPADNRDAAIAAYEAALEVMTLEDGPQEWAQAQARLGFAYVRRTHGDEADNLEKAITAYHKALEVLTPEQTPELWADIAYKLGLAYSNRKQGDSAENREQLIRLYDQVLAIAQRFQTTVDVGSVAYALGNAYMAREQGDRAANIEHAVEAFQEAVARRTPAGDDKSALSELEEAYGRVMQLDEEGAPAEVREAAWRDLEQATARALPFLLQMQALTGLGYAYQERLRGDKAENIEQAIGAFQQAQALIPRQVWANEWAEISTMLANAYTMRIKGGQGANAEDAISLYKQVLEIVSRDREPQSWAGVANNLAIAFMHRLQGDRADNLEQAIDLLRQVLDIDMRDGMSLDRAQALMNLGSLYRQRIRGDRADNIEQAIAAFQQALAAQPRPDTHAKTLVNFSAAYLERVRGDRAENIEQAISILEQARAALTPDSAPAEWASVMNNLGITYLERVRGDRQANVELAIDALKQALTVRTHEAMQLDWARTQGNLANAYRRRERGEAAENVEHALEALRGAAEVLTREVSPVEWATLMHGLGNAYFERKRGDRSDNLEQAIAAYEKVLLVRSPDTLPYDWAITVDNLGQTYLNRIQGNRAENLRKGIAYCQQALQVRTRKALPVDWAHTMHNLGNLYHTQYNLDANDNDFERAVESYTNALEVYRPDSLPDRCRPTASSLGKLYFGRKQWAEATEAFRQATQAAENAYQASLLRSSRERVIAADSDLYHRAAYALSRLGQMKEAALVLEKSRAHGLNEALARDRADLERVQAADPEAYTMYLEAATRLRNVESAERDEKVMLFADLFAKAQQAWDELQAAIARIRQVPGFSDFLAESDFGDISLAAEEGRPVAYLVTTSAGSAILYLVHSSTREANVEIIWADDLTAADLDTLLVRREGDEVVGGYLPGQLLNSVWLEEALGNVLSLFGQKLLGPLAVKLREGRAEGVVLVGCGLLGILPLHATSYVLDGRDTYFCDEFDVAYCPSARVLCMTRIALAANADRPARLVGVGNPLPNPNPLVFARAELEEIAAFFADDARTTLYEEAATEAELTKRLPGATYVHLACHGMFDPDEPLNSHLQLADQLLTLRQILDTAAFRTGRLVVLSACQTGITEYRRLPDEAIGLPAGFLQAGAIGVVGTLWPVDDLSTTLLMTKFYEFHLHSTEPPARALRHAQRWLREITAGELLDYFEEHRVSGEAKLVPRMPLAVAAGGVMRFALEDPASRPYADRPYHWAPFVFIGS